ncbi:MAG: glycosyltransferase family 2 protein [Thermoanaerobaculia bacterium]
MPSVAVITRTRNRPALLKRARRSVGDQGYRDFVWVIVNDAGEADPVEAIAGEARDDGVQTIVIHNPQSRGMEAASNLGIKSGESEFLVIHDDDDSWEPRFLQEMVEFLRSPQGQLYGGAISHTTWIQEQIRPSGDVQNMVKAHTNDHVLAVELRDVAGANPFPPISFLYRRSIYDLVGGYDESLPVLGDWDFNLRFLMHSDIGVVRAVLANYHHRVNAAGTTMANSLNRHAEYKAIFRNRLLRQDLASGRAGLGTFVNVMAELEELRIYVRYADPNFVTRIMGDMRNRWTQRMKNIVHRSPENR